MCSTSATIFVLSVYSVIQSSGWKAVPANQAADALRSYDDLKYITTYDEESDIYLPRDILHSTYKFGWCTPDAIRPIYMRKSLNISIATVKEARAQYIYLLDHKHTQNFVMQCVILKTYVPKRYQFRKSRIPIYYCQGQVFYMMLNTIQKILIHEFYMQQELLLPASFTFEFYQSPLL